MIPARSGVPRVATTVFLLILAGCGDDSAGPPPSDPLHFQSLSADGEYTCGITVDGATYCWGLNQFGQLGTGVTGIGTEKSVPTRVANDPGFSMVSAGGNTCALRPTGETYCWGLRSTYRGSFANPEVQTVPTAVAGAPPFVSIATGGFHACGLTSDGTAYCWGDNDWGQLGDGSMTSTFTPVQVTGGHRFLTITTGTFHSCGLTAAGTAYCWGDNSFGQVGRPQPAEPSCRVGLASILVDCSPIPVAVTGGLSFSQLGAGASQTCGLTADGTTYCWGNTTAPVDGTPRLGTPLPVVGSPALVRFSVGAGVCGLTATSELVCLSPDVLPVSGSEPVVDVAVGNTHLCVRTAAGLAYCAGQNRYGSLGNGSTTDSAELVAVVGPEE